MTVAWRRRTKIIATLGPASRSPEMIARLIEAGANVFRLNFSHSSQQIHGETIERIRAAAAAAKRPVGILQDLQGPKIRVGELVNHRPVELSPGGRVVLTTEAIAGDAERLPVTYAALPDDVRPDDAILLDDGRIQLRAVSVERREVICRVVIGGLVREHQGLNLPQTPLSASCLTEKDRDDLRFGLEHGVDFVALSFVREASDIEEVRKEARRMGRDVFVVAKIERVEAVRNLDAIARAADGIMVARGDLGVETSIAEVPLLQKRILRVAAQRLKPDITATQMLETMVTSPQPSRAEASDVANAVFDGTDALMLSAETAMGKYPVEAVRTMAEIASLAEQHVAEYGRLPVHRPREVAGGVSEATVRAACAAAAEVAASAIAVFTLSGRTAFVLAAMRPAVPILAFTPHDETSRRLTLAWGVTPVRISFTAKPEEMISVLDGYLSESGAPPGQRVVLVSGATTSPGATNIMRIHETSAGGSRRPADVEGRTASA